MAFPPLSSDAGSPLPFHCDGFSSSRCFIEGNPTPLSSPSSLFKVCKNAQPDYGDGGLVPLCFPSNLSLLLGKMSIISISCPRELLLGGWWCYRELVKDTACRIRQPKSWQLGCCDLQCALWAEACLACLYSLPPSNACQQVPATRLHACMGRLCQKNLTHKGRGGNADTKRGQEKGLHLIMHSEQSMLCKNLMHFMGDLYNGPARLNSWVVLILQTGEGLRQKEP